MMQTKIQKTPTLPVAPGKIPGLRGVGEQNPPENLPMNVYLELGVAAMKRDTSAVGGRLVGEVALLFAWTTLKAWDASLGGGGLVMRRTIKSVLKRISGLGETRVCALVQQGVGTYWREFHGKHTQERTGLHNIDYVTRVLQPTQSHLNPVRIAFRDMPEEGGKLSPFLISLFASSTRDMKPIAVGAIAKATGTSLRTVQRWLALDPRLKKLPNHQLIFSNEKRPAVVEFLQNTKSGPKYRIVGFDGDWRLVCQMANTYIMQEFDRLPLSKRPAALKTMDQCLAAKEHQRLYYVHEKLVKHAINEPLKDKHSLWLNGLWTDSSGRTVQVWQSF